ncbi:hypothetical protein SSS_08159 [Sarcoptes scabiei]|nr:hypothetical protein SSS_08159 [Sarcoptes scabiei]
MIFDTILIRYLLLWFSLSASTLFLNKHIISSQNGDAILLGIIQMFCCILTSYLTLIWTTKSLRNEHDDERKQLKFNLRYLFVNPHRLALIGALRSRGSLVYTGVIR